MTGASVDCPATPSRIVIIIPAVDSAFCRPLPFPWEKSLKRVALFALVAIIGFATSLAWFALAPVALPAASVDFSIRPGSALRSATRQIVGAGVPMAPWKFNLLARLSGRDRAIKAGSYQVSAGVTPWDILRKITLGDFTQSEIVFIEGWSFRQIRSALDVHADLRHDTAGMPGAQVMERVGEPGIEPEGQFFPDTYLFGKGESDVAVLARAHRAMRKQLQSTWQQRASALPFSSPYEALTLASIVEKETGQDGERSMIAGVLVNRLKLGMKLQADPTVIYGMGERFDGNLRKRDLLKDTPYNTYTRAGLPPHPIAMPGAASLLAAVNPANTQALYFVAKGDGTHQFSRSLEEHDRAVAKFQKNLNGRQLP